MATKKSSSAKSLLSKAKKLSASFAKNQGNMSKPTPNTMDNKGNKYYSPPPVLSGMSKPTPNTMDNKGNKYYSPPPVLPKASVPKSTGGGSTSSNVGVAGKGYWDTKGWVSGVPDEGYLKKAGTTLSGLGFSDTPLKDTPLADYYDLSPNEETYDPYAGDLSKKDEDKIRRDVIQRYQGQINATKGAYSRLLGDTQIMGKGRLGENVAQQARGGLLGSDFGQSQMDKTREFNRRGEQDVLGAEAQAISAIEAQAEADARAEIAAKREAKRYGHESYKTWLGEEGTRKKENMQKLAFSLLRQSIDPRTMGAKLKDIAKKYKTTESDIINAYLDAQYLQEQEDAAKGFTLSEGQAQYDAAGNLIASRAKTYAPKSTGGGSYYGTGAVSPAAQNILNLMNTSGGTVDDYVKGSSREAQALRNEVFAALSGQGGITDKSTQILEEGKAVIDDMINSRDWKKFGYSALIPFATRTTGYGDMQQRAQQISAIMARDNLGLLKGAMSDKDLAFLQSMSGGIDASGTISEEYAKQRMEAIQTKLAEKINAAQGTQMMMGGTQDVVDPEIQELLDLGYSEEQIQELINAQ